MGDPGDEKLMAYADGVLPASEHAEIAAMLEASADLRARLAMFAGTRADVVGAPLSAILAAPMPPRLVAAVMGAAASAAPAAAARTSGEVVSFRARPVKRPVSRRLWPAAIAAGIAGLAVVAADVVAVRDLRGPAEDAGSGAIAGTGLDMGTLAPKLARLVSGNTAAVSAPSGADWSVTPKLTFASNDGRWCREVNLRSTGAPAEYALVACRTGRWFSRAGDWTVEAAAQTGRQGGQKLGPASQSNAPPASIDSAITRLGSATPLTLAEEEKYIARGWRR
jgi:hypothetical protein